MKKILAIFTILITLFSCSVSDDTPRSHNEFLPIESVSIPDEFLRGQTYTVDLLYLKPSSCHIFNNIYYVAEANERTVAIVSEVFPANSGCIEAYTQAEASFNFRAENVGTYVFKFWQGENTDGVDEYYVVEVPVVE